jgi:hypothetical protein
MVVQDNKTGEIRIFVYLSKLNDACLHDPFVTPFTKKVLDNVGGLLHRWIFRLSPDQDC